jgi:hypothetical protein
MHFDHHNILHFSILPPPVLRTGLKRTRGRNPRHTTTEKRTAASATPHSIAAQSSMFLCTDLFTTQTARLAPGALSPGLSAVF